MRKKPTPASNTVSVRLLTYLLTYLLTELSPFWEAANCAATQELPSILWNPKVHHRLHKSPPMVPILSQINPVHTTPSHPISLRSILILATHLRLGLPSGLLPSGCPTDILYACFCTLILQILCFFFVLIKRNMSLFLISETCGCDVLYAITRSLQFKFSCMIILIQGPSIILRALWNVVRKLNTPNPKARH
jgi:hypothetical protein